jgi:uncharacterized membrane protein
MAPLIFLQAVSASSLIVSPGRSPGGSFAGLIGILAILTVALQMVAQSTIIYGAFQEMKGQEFSIGESLSIGFKRLFPVLGVGFMVALLAGLASILLLVPGLILLCMWYVVVPICVIEKPGVMASLSRSSDLTRGCRWQIFGLLLLVIVASFLITFILAFVAAMMGSAVIVQIVNGLARVLTVTYGAILVAVVYRDLRMAKEGVDTSKIANIFS